MTSKNAYIHKEGKKGMLSNMIKAQKSISVSIFSFFLFFFFFWGAACEARRGIQKMRAVSLKKKKREQQKSWELGARKVGGKTRGPEPHKMPLIFQNSFGNVLGFVSAFSPERNRKQELRKKGGKNTIKCSQRINLSNKISRQTGNFG